MQAIISLLVMIVKGLFDRARTVAGSIAIVASFGSIGVALLGMRSLLMNMIDVYFSDSMICALSAIGLFHSCDILFAAIGSALAVRLSRIVAARLAKLLDS